MRRSFTYVVFPLIVAVVSVVVMEAVVRTYFAFSVGPKVLLYGLISDPEVRVLDREPQTAVRRPTTAGEGLEWPLSTADAPKAGYVSYVPGQARVGIDPATGERFAASINAAGFRGADFAPEKPSGTVRVLALGSSSTLGSVSRDDETWPVALEAVLDEGCVAHDYEVLNLGLPNLRSEQVLALLLAEGLALDPDLVLYYGGRDDSRLVAPNPAPSVTWVGRLRRYSMLAAFMDNQSDFRGRRHDPRAFGARVREIGSGLIGNVSKMDGAARDAGIPFVFVTEQGQSNTIAPAELEGLSFDAERERIDQEIADGRPVLQPGEQYFLMHAELMDVLRIWAERARVTVVDGISALDGDRHELIGATHLTARGNRLLAEAVAAEVLAQTCPGAHRAEAVPSGS